MIMRLYGAIQKVEPQDDGTVRVHGIATSEAVDDQGEIVRADAMRAAIPDYMRFPALREMHQLSAAGTTLEAPLPWRLRQGSRAAKAMPAQRQPRQRLSAFSGTARVLGP